MNLNNYRKIKTTIPNNVELIVVSKRQEVDNIQKLYDEGHRVFGENRPQELRDKAEAMPNDIKWHYIGYLQTNKIKYIISIVDLIHSVDRVRLLKEINKHALNVDRVVDVLLQFHLAEEESKHGFKLDEIEDFLQSDDFKEMKNIRIRGVMMMASLTDDMQQVRNEFIQLKEIFNILKREFFADKDDFSEMSMGMSNDYNIAIEEGSTMVRIGSAIFK